ncbi:MAG: glycosyltransferase family 4 protein [Deltaproteobacteria bacterium]|nr:glycosyltransferase family 4 protein [Deltaproteobacteria bacterium]
MKKVLIIAYSFPPHPNIGSQRPYRLAKYFPRHGWEATVLSVKRSGKLPEHIRVIETDYNDVRAILKSKIGISPEKGLHEQLGINVTKNFKHKSLKSKLIKLVREIIAFPDPERGWRRIAIEAASELLKRERVDAIISTSSPVTSHLIARKLKHKFRIPWIADLRDLWTQNPYMNKFCLIKYFEKRLELRTLSYADALVTVTEPWIDTLKAIHRDKKVYCVTNGYDDDDFTKLSSKLTSKFTLTYTGTLYSGKRDPSLLFKVTTELINKKLIDRDLIEIRFYGPEENWLIDDIKRNNMDGVVRFCGFLPRNEVLKRQRESQLLLLLLWDNKNEAGFCPAKVYEYFGAGRPIIAIGGQEHVVKGMLETTNAGKYTWNFDMLRYALLEYYNEFVEFGKVKCASNSNIENYTYDAITNRYSEILNGLVTK